MLVMAGAILFGGLTAIGIYPGVASARAAGNTGEIQALASGTNYSKPLCLPGIYLEDPVDCQPVGPSAYLTEMAQKGITFPLTQLAVSKPDFELTYVDRRYGQIRTANAPVFGSVEDAMSGNKGKAILRIDSPFAYISYTDEAVLDGKRFYMIDYGQWMTANDVIRLGSVPLFQGLTFRRTPEIGRAHV